DRAAIERFAFVLLVIARVAADEADGLPDVRWLIGVRAFAAGLVLQQATDVERIVADFLGVEAETRAAGEETVFRVALPQLRRCRGGLPVRGGSYDAPDEGLHVPA